MATYLTTASLAVLTPGASTVFVLTAGLSPTFTLAELSAEPSTTAFSLTRTVRVTSPDAPASCSPRSQVTTVWPSAPAEAVPGSLALTKVRPAGRASLTTTCAVPASVLAHVTV